MGYYYVMTRQQFIIPTTPIATYPASSLGAEENDGTGIPSNTTTDGDSYMTRYWLPGGGMPWNFHFMVDADQLPAPTDYFVCTASLSDIAGELVMQITRFVGGVPYPSYRVRIDLSLYPYSTLSVAPISLESDITQVTFSESLDWTDVKFGVAPLSRSHWFCKLDGFASPRLPFNLPFGGHPFFVTFGVKNFHPLYP